MCRSGLFNTPILDTEEPHGVMRGDGRGDRCPGEGDTGQQGEYREDGSPDFCLFGGEFFCPLEVIEGSKSQFEEDFEWFEESEGVVDFRDFP